MAKKFGDDRSKDRDLNTEIDMEEMDDLNMDDPFGGGGVDDNGGRSPAKATRAVVTQGVKGMAEGAASALNEELERNMPNLFTVKSELSDSYQDLKDVKDEIAKQLQPMMQSLENSTRKVLPRVEKLMPKSWYNKLKQTLDDRAAERSGGTYSKEQQRADLISSELSSVFAEQAELNKHNEFEQNKNRIMDRAISSTQHRASQHAMMRIYDSLRSTELFHRTLHTAYMKKSLELQYKHLFVAQDTHNLLAKSLAAYEEYFKGIVKNTGLPDVMKTQASDYIKKSRTEKYGMMMSEYLSNARKMIFNKIKSGAKDLLDNLSMATSAAEMGADMSEMMDDPMMNPGGVKGMMAGWGGKMLGKAMAVGPIRSVMEKMNPYLKAVNGDLDNIKTRAYMGMDKLRSEWGGSSTWWKSAIASFLPSMAAAKTGSNDLLTRSEDAASFDRLTRQSIVEIIPGYLGKIWHSVEKLRTGNENVEEQTYNIYKRDFTGVSELQKDLYSDPRMFGSKSAQTAAVGQAIGVLQNGNVRNGMSEEDAKLDPELQPTISRIIANHGVYHLHFEPKKLVEYMQNAEALQKDSYLQKIHDGVENDRLFAKAVRAIVRGLGYTKEHPEFNSNLVRRFEDSIHSIRTNADGMKERLAWANENLGLRRHMRDKADVYDADGNLISKGQKGFFKDNNDLNLTLAGDYLSPTGTAEEIDNYRKWQYGQVKEYLDAKDLLSAKVSELKNDAETSMIGKFLIDNWGKFQAWRRDNSEAVEGVELGPSTPTGGRNAQQEKAASGVINPATPESKTAFGQILDRVILVALDNKIQHPENGEKLDKLIQETEQIRVQYEEGKINLVSATKKVIALKENHPEAFDSVSTQSGLNIVTKGKNRLMSIASATPIVKNFVDRVPTGATVKKWFSDGLDKLPQDKAAVAKMVEEKKHRLDEMIAASPKDKEAAIKMCKEFADKLRKDHPEAAKALDEKIGIFKSFVKDNIVESRVGKFASAVGGYVGDLASPYVDEATKWMEEKGDRAKNFASKKAQEMLVKAGINQELVNRAAGGDKESQDKIKAQLRDMAKAKIDEFKDNHLTKEGLKHDAETVKTAVTEGLTEAKKYTAEKSVELAGQAGTAAAAVSDFAKTLMSEFRKSAGMPESPEKTEKADTVDKTLIDLLSTWQASTTKEHNMIFDLLSAIQQAGIPTTAGGAASGAAAAGGGVAEAIRQRYGVFGKGGAAIRKGVTALGKAAWKTAKWGAGIYGKTYSGVASAAMSALGGTVSGIKKVGQWIANDVGINPYVDIYVKGQEDKKPVITWRKQAFGAGVVYGVQDGEAWKPGTERVEASKDIPKKGVPVFDPKTGNMLITEEDLQKGLWTAQGPLAQTGRILTAISRGVFGVYGKALGGVASIGKIVAEGIFGSAGQKQETFVDIYLKGRINEGPLVTRRQQIKGTVAFANGEKVERSSDIHEPVYDTTTTPPSILITEEQIKQGLVDVNGRALGTYSAGKEGLAGKLFNLGGTVAKGIFGKTGMKIVGGALMGLGSIYKGMFDALLGGGKSLGRGIANIGARIFGFDTPGGFGKKAFDGIYTRLDRIISLLSSGAGGGGGSGGSTTGSTEAPAPKDHRGRGKRGYWKDGKFIPDPKGDSYEKDGADHPGGAQANHPGEETKKSDTNDVTAHVDERAKTSYVHTSWDNSGVEGGGEGEGGMDAMDALMYADMAKSFLPASVRRKLLKAKRALKGAKAKAWNAVRHPVKSSKAAWAAAKRGAGKVGGAYRGMKSSAKAWKAAYKHGGMKAVKTRLARKLGSKVSTRTAAKLGGKVGKLARFGGKFGKVAKLGTAAAGALGLGKLFGGGAASASSGAAAKSAANAAKMLGKGAKFMKFAKFLGPAMTIATAGLDAYEGWNSAGEWLGKDDKDLTTGDKVASAASGALNGATMGISSGVAKLLYGSDTDINAETAKVLANPGEAASAVGTVLNDALNPWSKNNQERKKLDEDLKNLNAKVKDLQEQKIKALNDAAQGYDVGPKTATTCQNLFNRFRKETAVTNARLKEATDQFGSVWKDSKLMAQFKTWIKDNYPPDSSDKKGRYEYFMKLYKNPKRETLNRGILRLFGIQDPMSEGEWNKAKNELEIAAEIKPDEKGKDAASEAAVAATATKDSVTGGEIKGSHISRDPVKRFEDFKKIYTDKDRATKYDAGMLQAYGIDFADDPDEWQSVYKELELKAKAAREKDPEKYAKMDADAAKAEADAKNLGRAKPTVKPKEEKATDEKGKDAASKSEDAQAKYDAFMKLYNDPDRAKKKAEAAKFGVDFPEDADEWEDVKKELGLKVKAAKANAAKSEAVAPTGKQQVTPEFAKMTPSEAAKRAQAKKEFGGKGVLAGDDTNKKLVDKALELLESLVGHRAIVQQFEDAYVELALNVSGLGSGVKTRIYDKAKSDEEFASYCGANGIILDKLLGNTSDESKLLIIYLYNKFMKDKKGVMTERGVGKMNDQLEASTSGKINETTRSSVLSDYGLSSGVEQFIRKGAYTDKDVEKKPWLKYMWGDPSKYNDPEYLKKLEETAKKQWLSASHNPKENEGQTLATISRDKDLTGYTATFNGKSERIAYSKEYQDAMKEPWGKLVKYDSPQAIAAAKQAYEYQRLANGDNVDPTLLQSKYVKDYLADQAASRIDVSQLAPVKPGDIIKPAELDMQSSIATKNRFDTVSAAIKTQPAPQLEMIQNQQEQFAEMMKQLNPWVDAMQEFSKAVSKDGIKVQGMDTLTAVTAAKPEPAAPQIINNTIVQEENKGLDLRKKQL